MSDKAVRRIVVADDNTDIVDLLTINLVAAGYEVSSASDGEAARNLVLKTLPDLVVLDLMMPKLDGLEVLRDLRARPQTREIPVVVLTAKTNDADVWEGWGSGADYYMTKPFDLDELLRFLDYLEVNGAVPGGDGPRSTLGR